MVLSSRSRRLRALSPSPAVFVAMFLFVAGFGAAYPSGAPDALLSGPRVLDVKGVAEIGIGFQEDVCPEDMVAPIPDGILYCGYKQGPDDIHQHDVSGCLASGGCVYDVWAIQSGGAEVSGWGITACVDLDAGSRTCQTGSMVHGYQGRPLTASQDKQPKNDSAHLEFCAHKASNGTYDAFYVYISTWVAADMLFDNEYDSTGAGFGMGTFQVYVDGGAAVDSTACQNINGF